MILACNFFPVKFLLGYVVDNMLILQNELGSIPPGNVYIKSVLLSLKEAVNHLCWKVFNYMFNLLNRIGLFRHSISSYITIG